MTTERRSIGVTVGWLAVLAVAGLVLVNLVRTLTSVRATPEAVARPVPAEAAPRDGAFAPIPIDVDVTEPPADATSAVSGDYARVAEFQQAGDADELVQLVSAPVEAGADDGRQHELRVRVSAIHALATVGSDRAMTFLHDLIEHDRHELVLRLAAVSALARTGPEAEVAYLRGRLDAEPSRIVREKIRLELEQREGSPERG